jgi:poly(A) polymerase
MDKALQLQKAIDEIFGDNPVNLVGGSVRDIILGHEPKDWDYCTPLQPDTVEQMVRDAGRKPYLTGKRFGTIGFKIKLGAELELNLNGQDLDSDDFDANKVTAGKPKEIYQYIEVTTYRTEKYDGVSRKPTVDFTRDLLLDLSRRDFTINSIVLTKDGDYFDPHGGRIDILAKKIKAVGKGKDRILEDPLRMLRAARFAARLDFEVDPNFIGVMRQHSSEITRVSKERWVAELDKILSSPYPQKGLDILMQTELMKYILPEVWLAFQDDVCKANTYEQFDVMLKDGRFTLDDMWCMLTYYIGFPYTKKVSKDKVTFPGNREVRKELAIGLCSRLKFSNERTTAMLKVPTTKIQDV